MTDDTIRADELRAFPERPESEFEWDDLLLRIEIMSRALRVEMEHAGRADVGPILAELTGREGVVRRLLEEVAVSEPIQRDGGESAGGRTAEMVEGQSDQRGEATGTGSVPASEIEAGPEGDVNRFVRLRGRNFAMLQRRGIDVWNWRIRSAPAAGATVFQLLSLLAGGDVEILARLRRARAGVSDSC